MRGSNVLSRLIVPNRDRGRTRSVRGSPAKRGQTREAGQRPRSGGRPAKRGLTRGAGADPRSGALAREAGAIGRSGGSLANRGLIAAEQLRGAARSAPRYRLEAMATDAKRVRGERKRAKPWGAGAAARAVGPVPGPGRPSSSGAQPRAAETSPAATASARRAMASSVERPAMIASRRRPQTPTQGTAAGTPLAVWA